MGSGNSAARQSKWRGAQQRRRLRGWNKMSTEQLVRLVLKRPQKFRELGPVQGAEFLSLELSANRGQSQKWQPGGV